MGTSGGIFRHLNELRPDEVANLADALVQGGASLKSNTQMVAFLLGCQANDVVPQGYAPGSYYACPSSGVEVTYRGRGHAMARVIDPASIAALKNGADDGVRGSVRHVAMPAARTSVDCEAAALALLDDAGYGWAGQYQAWSQFLPGNSRDVFPGDGLGVNAPSRDAAFLAIVSEVEIEAVDISREIFRYTLRFTDAGNPGWIFDLKPPPCNLAAF